MSLMDFVLQQQLILISLGVVILPLVIALLVSIGGILRRVKTQRSQKRDAITAQVQTIVNHLPAQEIATTIPAPQPTTEATSEDDKETAKKEDAEEDNEQTTASNAMQDILTSVFVDEEADARYTALMDNEDPAHIDDVHILLLEVAEQMGIGIQSDVEEGEPV